MYKRRGSLRLIQYRLKEIREMANVAWLGLGVMGYPMAGHLKVRGGNSVVVYNRSPAKAEAWCAKFGGKTAATPAEAARDCDAVVRLRR